MKEIPRNAFIVHRHRAKRAGEHLDLRMREGEGFRYGRYGAGTLEVFCRGTYETIEKTDKAWKFRLTSDKCEGVFVLVRMRENNFLLMQGKM